MKRLTTYIRAIGKNPYLEVAAGVLIIAIALYEFVADVEKSMHSVEGVHALLLFGLMYLARTITISFDGIESIDVAETSRFHQKNALAVFLHRVAHSPHAEITVGILLFAVGLVEIWENIREEMVDFERWHIGLIVLGVYLMLRSLTALVKGLVLFEESEYLRHLHTKWIRFIISPCVESLVGVALLLIGIIEEVINLSTANPLEVQEYHTFIVFGIVSILRFFPDAYDGIVMTENSEQEEL